MPGVLATAVASQSEYLGGARRNGRRMTLLLHLGGHPPPAWRVCWGCFVRASVRARGTVAAVRYRLHGHVCCLVSVSGVEAQAYESLA